MKESVIIKLLNGKLGHENIKCGDMYKMALNNVIENEKKLKNALSEHPKLIDLYEDFNNSIDSLNIELGNDFFVAGFKVGMLLAIELFQE